MNEQNVKDTTFLSFGQTLVHIISLHHKRTRHPALGRGCQDVFRCEQEKDRIRSAILTLIR